MVFGNLAVMLIIGVVVGVGLAYWWFDQQISKQKNSIEEQNRQRQEEQDRSYLIRVQQAVQEAEQKHQNQLQQAIQTSETQYQAQLKQMSLELQEKDTQVEQLNQSLLDSKTQVAQLTEQLQASEDQVTQLNDFLIQYQTMLAEVNAELESTQAQVEQLSQVSTGQEFQSEILPELVTPEIELTQALPETSEAISFVEDEVLETETPVFEDSIVEEVVETEIPVFEDSIVEEIVETETPVFESPTVEENVAETPVFESSNVEEVVTVPTTKTGSEEELIGQISEIGTSGNFASINTLTGYLQHPNHEVRYAVAATLGKLTASGRLSREVQQSIPILTRLSQDLDPRVRQEAIIALGKIPSHQVIPILQKALRDSQISVAQSASIALNKFKVYRVRPKSLPKSLMLKKPNISKNPE